MRCASVGSGSKGNALLVESDETLLLIDCGFPFSHIERGVESLGRRVGDIEAVFITHEHGDHIRGVKTFAKKTSADIYMSYGTAEAASLLALPRLHFVNDSEPVTLGDLSVLPVTVPHDAREPYQYVIRQWHAGACPSSTNENAVRADDSRDYRSLGVLTDLGSVPKHVVSAYSRCDALVIEANHDETMLREGKYPASLKRRVGGQWGHLSNHQTARFLDDIDQERLQWMMVAHISEQNNCPQKLADTLASGFADTHKIHYAEQENGFQWMTID